MYKRACLLSSRDQQGTTFGYTLYSSVIRLRSSKLCIQLRQVSSQLLNKPDFIFAHKLLCKFYQLSDEEIIHSFIIIMPVIKLLKG